MKKYKKLMVNPFGLPSGVIYTDTFTDEKLTKLDEAKLKAALKAGLIVEVDATKEAQDTGIEADDAVTELTKKLAEMTAQRDNAVAESLELKKDLVAGWEGMDAETLAKEFTVPELKFIAEQLGIDFSGNIKEAALAKKIVEANNVDK